MLTSTQRQAVFDGIPYILAGVTCTKVLSRQYVETPTLPSVTVSYLTDSNRLRAKGHELRSSQAYRNADYDVTEGYIAGATIGLTISSEDYSQLMDMAADMMVQLYRDRLDMIWWDYRVKFIQTLNSPLIDSYRYEEDRKLVFRAHIDFFLEYEVSWTVTDPAIHLVCTTIEVGNIAKDDLKSIEYVMYGPGLWGMETTLVNDRFKYTLDTLLRKNKGPSTYTMDMKLVDYGDTLTSSCEMSLTLE